MTNVAAPANDTVDARKPPYPGFGTFLNFLERLGKHGVPGICQHFLDTELSVRL